MNSNQRKQQRKAFIRHIKKKIAQDGFNGVFTTDQIIEKSGSASFMFIGEHKGRECVWNTRIVTADSDYFHYVQEMASDTSYEEFPIPDDYTPLKFSPCEWSRKGKPTAYALDEDEETRDIRRRRSRWASLRTLELLDSKALPLPRWSLEIDERYRWRVGLRVRIDKPYIELDDVYQFIDHFNRDREDLLRSFDSSLVAKTAEELNVCLCESGEYIIWKNHPQMNFGEKLTRLPGALKA